MPLALLSVLVMFVLVYYFFFFFFSSRRRHTRCSRDWSSDVCSSDLWPPESARAPSPSAVTSSSTKASSGPTPGRGWSFRSEERREGKSVDLGGRRIIKKKKK